MNRRFRESKDNGDVKYTESRKSMKENRFDDIIRDVENLLLDDRVLKSIEGYEKEYTELAYMLAERLNPNDYAMSTEDDLAREIEDMLVRGKIKIEESKKSARKSLKEKKIIMNVWEWGDVKGVDEETCDNMMNYAKKNEIDYMNMTEDEFNNLKDEYLMVNYGNKGVFKKSLKEKKFNPNDYFYELIELNGKKYKDWTVFEWKDIEDDFFKAYATWGKTFFNMYSGNGDSNSLVNDGKLMSVLDKNGVQIIGKELNEIAYELNELIRNYKKTESKKSVGKSIKESKDSDFFNGIAKEYHFSKDEKTRYKDKTYISAIGVLFDRINDSIKIYGRNSDEEYNALNDCWEVISSAKQNGWNVDYEEDRWNKIAGLPNYH